jgi:hypothetical protein
MHPAPVVNVTALEPAALRKLLREYGIYSP